MNDDSLEDSANLPSPDELAGDIIEDLETALEQFAGIQEELEKASDCDFGCRNQKWSPWSKVV